MYTYKICAAICTVALMTACGRGQNDEHGHSHDESLQLTSYGDRFELFAEAMPFVAGQASEITAHFSDLENFTPLREGRVTASFIIEDEGIRQTADAPVRPGIYQFSLTPAITGTGILTFDIETDDGISRITVPGVTVFADEHEAHKAAAQSAITSSNAVTFTKEQSWKIDFATATVQPAPFGQVIRTTAQILPAQGDETIITAKASGTVSFTGDNIVEGRPVAAGQALFSVNSGNMADDNLNVRYTEAQARYNRAKADFARKKELAVDRIVSQSDLLEAETAFLEAEAVYNNLRQNFSYGKQTISSPIGGYVRQVFVRNGEFVAAGQPIIVISQNRDLLMTANLQPRYSHVLGNIVSANIRILNTGKTYTLDELGGSVVSYGRAADTGNPLIPVTFRVRNNGSLLPGSFVEMFINTRETQDALTVPNEAIVEEMGSFFVFVQMTGELFEKRAVSTGATDGQRTVITEGIESGERIVTRGAVSVRLAQAAIAVDPHSGHAH